MIRVSEYVFEKRLKYHRKIHVYKNLWLVSLYSSNCVNGKYYWNIRNILLYPFTFLFIPITVDFVMAKELMKEADAQSICEKTILKNLRGD